MFRKNISLIALVLAAFLTGSVAVGAEPSNQPVESHGHSFGSELAIDAVAMREELQALVEKYGLEVTEFDLSVSIPGADQGDYGTTSSCEGCTIAVNITIPGGTGVEVSATASDCLGAWSQIAQVAEEIGGRIGDLIMD